MLVSQLLIAHGEAGTGTHLLEMIALLLFSSVPITAIVLFILVSPRNRSDSELGPGEVSLHEEMWEYIDSLEYRKDQFGQDIGADTVSPMTSRRD